MSERNSMSGSSSPVYQKGIDPRKAYQPKPRKGTFIYYLTLNILVRRQSANRTPRQVSGLLTKVRKYWSHSECKFVRAVTVNKIVKKRIDNFYNRSQICILRETIMQFEPMMHLLDTEFTNSTKKPHYDVEKLN